MKITISTLALGLILTACGTEQKPESQDLTGPRKITDTKVLEALNQNDVAPNVITRVPVVNGIPDYSRVEAVGIKQSVDANNASAIAKAFDDAKATSSITVNAFASDDLDESSSQQFRRNHRYGPSGRYPRATGYLLPWRRHQANLNNDLLFAAGYNGHDGFYQPYQQQGGCCCVQTVCTVQTTCLSSSFSSYQYSSFSSQGGSWYGAF
jgi:hypothetical protein